MSKMAVSRRTFLKLFAGVSAGVTAQLSGLFRGALIADAATVSPLRFIVITQPHANTKYWAPRMPGGAVATHGATGWSLAYDTDVTDLAPMQKHKDSLVVIDGLDFYCCYKPGSTGSLGHQAAVAATSGTDLKTVDDRTARGPSIDIAIAQYLGVEPKIFRFADAMNSWDASGNAYGAVAPQFTNDTSVVVAYRNLFSTLTPPATDPKAAARLAAQKSVLNYLNTETKSLRTRLAAAEKQKLDQHLDTLSLIEKQLAPPPAGVSCSKPPSTGSTRDDDYGIDDQVRFSLVNQYIATLFACNMTRVAAFHMNINSMPWLSYNGTPLPAAVHNDVVHMMVQTDDPSIRRVALIHSWYAAQVSALCDLLKTVDDGNGKTAYDNTIILWTNELGNPVDHLPYNVPFVLAGGGGSYAKGRYLSYGAGNTNAHNPLLVSMANQFGMNVQTFGDTSFTGGLPGL
jgi:hypothetical protein